MNNWPPKGPKWRQLVRGGVFSSEMDLFETWREAVMLQ